MALILGRPTHPVPRMEQAAPEATADQDFIDRRELRENIIHEDYLLGSRTTIFILVTTALYAALALSPSRPFRVLFAILGFTVSVLWMTSSGQSWRALTNLHRAYFNRFDDPIKAVIFTNIGWRSPMGPKFYGPTEIVAWWIPGTFIAAWIVVGWFVVSV